MELRANQLGSIPLIGVLPFIFYSPFIHQQVCVRVNIFTLFLNFKNMDVKTNPATTGKKKVGLLDKLKAIAMLNLAFTNVTSTKDQNGKFIAILQLANPIALVRGSQNVSLATGSVGVTATDVREIKVHQDDIVDYDEKTGEGFAFDEEGTGGSYKGSELVLDVSKANREVWLKRTSFATAGAAYRTQLQSKKLEEMFAPKATGSTGASEPNDVN